MPHLWIHYPWRHPSHQVKHLCNCVNCDTDSGILWVSSENFIIPSKLTLLYLRDLSLYFKMALQYSRPIWFSANEDVRLPIKLENALILNFAFVGITVHIFFFFFFLWFVRSVTIFFESVMKLSYSTILAGLNLLLSDVLQSPVFKTTLSYLPK